MKNSKKKNDTQSKNYTNDSKAKIQMMKQMIQKKIQIMKQMMIQKRRFK